MYIAWSCSAESLQGCLVQVGNDIELDTIARSHHKGATGRVQTGKVIKLLRILAFYRRIHPLDALPLNLSSSWAPSLGAVQHLPGGLACHPHTWCACLSNSQWRSKSACCSQQAAPCNMPSVRPFSPQSTVLTRLLLQRHLMPAPAEHLQVVPGARQAAKHSCPTSCSCPSAVLLHPSLDLYPQTGATFLAFSCNFY